MACTSFDLVQMVIYADLVQSLTLTEGTPPGLHWLSNLVTNANRANRRSPGFCSLFLPRATLHGHRKN